MTADRTERNARIIAATLYGYDDWDELTAEQQDNARLCAQRIADDTATRAAGLSVTVEPVVGDNGSEWWWRVVCDGKDRGHGTCPTARLATWEAVTTAVDLADGMDREAA